MKNIIYIILLGVAVLAFGCDHDSGTVGAPGAGELMFTSVVQDHDDVYTRSYGNNFFEVGNGLSVYITSSRDNSTSSYNYTYSSDGVFRGVPSGYRFSLDDNYISKLLAIWPDEEIRSEPFPKDQTDFDDFHRADWMQATATLGGIMPTDAPVPLNFNRENTMIEFELAGQNTLGLAIASLVIELQDLNGLPAAYRAYCGDGTGHAKLIVEPGTALISPDHYLIGRLTVPEGQAYTVIFPETDIVLEKGKRYLVTLTPQGYDIDAFVFLAGWSQTEYGIGIPFAPPVPLDNGDFTIYEPQQLIAMSYLMRHYNDGSTFDWYNRNYYIDDSFTMSEKEAALYIPVPASEFNGQIFYMGAAIYSLEYGDGQLLQLFD